MSGEALDKVNGSKRTVDEGVKNELPVLFHQIIDVTKDSTSRRSEEFIFLVCF